MNYQSNLFRRPKTESERFVEMAKAIAAIAALECADDLCEFGRIQRSILTALQQNFPEIYLDTTEELD